jgi:hypothetical protein
MKNKAKFCWFCDKQVYSFVSICSACEKERRFNKEKAKNIKPLYNLVNVLKNK